MKSYGRELSYIEEHYTDLEDQGYLTEEVYEWLDSKVQLLGLKTLTKLISDLQIVLIRYTSGHAIDFKPTFTEFELKSFIQTLDFLAEQLDEDERERAEYESLQLWIKQGGA